MSVDKKNMIKYNFLLSKVQAMVGTAEFVAPEVGLITIVTFCHY